MTSSIAVDDYVSGFSAEVQDILTRLRATITAAAPDAFEEISYNIPAFKQAGTYVLYMAAWKKHVALYPALGLPESLEAEVAPYRSTKGTVKFLYGKPVPYELVTKIVAARLEQIGAAGA